MKHAQDNIRVSRITLIYSVMQRGWVYPDGQVIKNPLKAQRIAEQIHNRKVAG